MLENILRYVLTYLGKQWQFHDFHDKSSPTISKATGISKGQFKEALSGCEAGKISKISLGQSWFDIIDMIKRLEKWV